jgi:hypothetical protein
MVWLAAFRPSKEILMSKPEAFQQDQPFCASRRDKVTKAMKVCARNAFLPEAHRNPGEAFLDSPIHLDGLHFNVSAPHMHATCLVRNFGPQKSCSQLSCYEGAWPWLSLRCSSTFQ